MSNDKKREEDTDFFTVHSQSKKNTFYLKLGFSIIAGLLTLLCSILAWLGSGVVSKVDKSMESIADVRVSMAEVKSEVGSLKEGMKTVALKSDVEILKSEIAAQHQEIEMLRRRAVTTRQNP